MSLPRLVFLHGFTGCEATFGDVRQRLLPHKFFAPRLHGHGRVPNLEATSFGAESLRLAREIAQWSGGERCHLCGYSLGGRVALSLLVSSPELFSGATLIGAHPGLVAEAERAARREQDRQWRAMIEKQGVADFLTAWAAQPLFASELSLPAERLTHRAEERREHTGHGLASALLVLGLADMPDHRNALAALHTPLTLMAGAHDQKFAELAQEMARTTRRGRAILADGSGHNLLLGSPHLVAKVLKEALDPTVNSKL